MLNEHKWQDTKCFCKVGIKLTAINTGYDEAKNILRTALTKRKFCSVVLSCESSLRMDWVVTDWQIWGNRIDCERHRVWHYLTTRLAPHQPPSSRHKRSKQFLLIASLAAILCWAEVMWRWCVLHDCVVSVFYWSNGFMGFAVNYDSLRRIEAFSSKCTLIKSKKISWWSQVNANIHENNSRKIGFIVCTYILIRNWTNLARIAKYTKLTLSYKPYLQTKRMVRPILLRDWANLLNM